MADNLNKSEKAKGILAKIAGLFAAQETTVEHKLADGTILKADKFEVGGKIEGITAIGSFTLPDGKKISYDIAGVITEVTPPPPATATFTDYKLADGTTISCDKLEAGGMAKINGQPAPAGTYALEDGSSITVDATGAITAVTPKAAVAATAPDMSTPAGMLAAYDKFASGTIDAVGTATILKALMEYCFGWQLREAAAKKVTEDAMAVYQNTLNSTASQLPAVVAQNKAQGAMLKQMFELMTEVLGMPTADAPGAEGKKKYSFVDTDARKKSFEKFQQSAKKLAEQWKEMEKVA